MKGSGVGGPRRVEKAQIRQYPLAVSLSYYTMNAANICFCVLSRYVGWLLLLFGLLEL